MARHFLSAARLSYPTASLGYPKRIPVAQPQSTEHFDPRIGPRIAVFRGRLFLTLTLDPHSCQDGRIGGGGAPPRFAHVYNSLAVSTDTCNRPEYCRNRELPGADAFSGLAEQMSVSEKGGYGAASGRSMLRNLTTDGFAIRPVSPGRIANPSYEFIPLIPTRILRHQPPLSQSARSSWSARSAKSTKRSSFLAQEVRRRSAAAFGRRGRSGWCSGLGCRWRRGRSRCRRRRSRRRSPARPPAGGRACRACR